MVHVTTAHRSRYLGRITRLQSPYLDCLLQNRNQKLLTQQYGSASSLQLLPCDLLLVSCADAGGRHAQVHFALGHLASYEI